MCHTPLHQARNAVCAWLHADRVENNASDLSLVVTWVLITMPVCYLLWLQVPVAQSPACMDVPSQLCVTGTSRPVPSVYGRPLPAVCYRYQSPSPQRVWTSTPDCVLQVPVAQSPACMDVPSWLCVTGTSRPVPSVYGRPLPAVCYRYQSPSPQRVWTSTPDCVLQVPVAQSPACMDVPSWLCVTGTSRPVPSVYGRPLPAVCYRYQSPSPQRVWTSTPGCVLQVPVAQSPACMDVPSRLCSNWWGSSVQPAAPWPHHS